MRIVLATLFLVLTPSLAAAQPKGYVQAGVLATSQSAGTPNHRVHPGLGGNTVGVAAAVGFFVSPRVSVEAELVAGPPISTAQRFSYNWSEDFTGESRDVFAGANVRWRPVALLELFGGGGLAFGTFAERSIVETRLPFPGQPNVPTSQPDRVATEVQLAVNGGVAVPLSVSRRIAIVPAFAFRVIGRPGGQAEYLGVGMYAYHYGASVRFSFD